MNFKKQFGLRLAEIRDNNELSQSELGELSGLGASNISHFETGSRAPGLENLIKILKALKHIDDELNVNYLLGIE